MPFRPRISRYVRSLAGTDVTTRGIIWNRVDDICATRMYYPAQEHHNSRQSLRSEADSRSIQPATSFTTTSATKRDSVRCTGMPTPRPILPRKRRLGYTAVHGNAGCRSQSDSTPHKTPTLFINIRTLNGAVLQSSKGVGDVATPFERWLLLMLLPECRLLMRSHTSPARHPGSKSHRRSPRRSR